MLKLRRLAGSNHGNGGSALRFTPLPAQCFRNGRDVQDEFNGLSKGAVLSTLVSSMLR
jgi:hypothetical protein